MKSPLDFTESKNPTQHNRNLLLSKVSLIITQKCKTMVLKSIIHCSFFTVFSSKSTHPGELSLVFNLINSCNQLWVQNVS